MRPAEAVASRAAHFIAVKGLGVGISVD
jgi:hypothetical protein